MKEIDEQLTQAKELWDDGKQAQAIQILEELDEKTPTTQVAELLNHFYVANQQYSEALQLVANQSTNFLHHPGVFADYLGALIATNNFIVAWKTLASADQQIENTGDGDAPRRSRRPLSGRFSAKRAGR